MVNTKDLEERLAELTKQVFPYEYYEFDTNTCIKYNTKTHDLKTVNIKQYEDDKKIRLDLKLLPFNAAFFSPEERKQILKYLPKELRNSDKYRPMEITYRQRFSVDNKDENGKLLSNYIRTTIYLDTNESNVEDITEEEYFARGGIRISPNKHLPDGVVVYPAPELEDEYSDETKEEHEARIDKIRIDNNSMMMRSSSIVNKPAPPIAVSPPIQNNLKKALHPYDQDAWNHDHVPNW